MKQTKYKYFKTLGDSIRLIIQKPKILVPLIIGLIIALISAPFMLKLQDPVVLYANIWLLLGFYVLMIVYLIIFYGWTFSIINQALTKKKIELGKAFKNSFRIGLKTFVIGVLSFIFMMLVYFMIAILITLSVVLLTLIKIPQVGAVVGIILGALLLLFLLLYVTAILQTIPVLIVEDKGIIETIKQAMRFYFKKKIYSLNLFLISFIIMMILSIPAFIYQFVIMFGAITVQQMPVYTVIETLVLQGLSLIPGIFMFVILVFYAKSYMIKKETIK